MEAAAGTTISPPEARFSVAELLAAVLDPVRPQPLVPVASQVMAAGLRAWAGSDACERAIALGLSRRQAMRLVSCAVLVCHLEAEEWPMPAPITCPTDVLAHIGDIRTGAQERVVALYVDARHRPMHRETVAVGGLRSSVIQPRDVIAPALRIPAAGLILAHNHPSGDTRPSCEDIEVTGQLAAAARLFGLELLDHLVVSRSGYCSLKELGKM